MHINSLKKNFNLKNLNTLKVNAVAEYFFEAKSRQDIIDICKLAKKNKLSFKLLGVGSNIGFTSKHIKGVLIKNSYIKKELIKETSSFLVYSISSGYPTTKLSNETIEKGYKGLEYHIGLPGTIGGAIYMNSKWLNPPSYIGDLVMNAYLLDKNLKIKKVDNIYFNFKYDYSILQDTKEILLEAELKFIKSDPNGLIKISKECFDIRKKTQPFGLYTSGCFFRNISDEEKIKNNLPTKSAGYLIDKCCLKGLKIGDFKVSEKHANFIINNGYGKPNDLKKILQIIKNKVYQKFGLQLKEEVELIN